MTHSPDDALRERLLAGDHEALAAAFAACRARLKQTIKLRLDRRLCGRLDESDVVQDTWLAAVRDLHSYSTAPDVTVFVWLHRLMTRRLCDLHREHLDAGKRSVHREGHSLNESHELPDGRVAAADILATSLTSPSKAILKDERQRQVLLGLDAVDDIDREVLLLRHFEMMSNDETAMVLGLSPTAASNRHVRALRRLSTILSEIMELT